MNSKWRMTVSRAMSNSLYDQLIGLTYILGKQVEDNIAGFWYDC